MQEVWDLFQLEELPEPTEEPVEQLNLAISHDAHMGSQGPRTIQFQGSIQGQSIVVLIDSGSSASFLAESIASRLPELTRTALTASVKIANGQLLRCSSVIEDCHFALGEYQFKHDLRILQLDSYDLILGIDWLARYSPMQVHWESKWLSIPYHGSQIFLQGITAPQPGDLVFQVLAADLTSSDSEPPALPTEISEILLQFPEVFKIPDSLPPKRSCDHAIPLVSGASPVNIRAYRYPQASRMKLISKSRKCSIMDLFNQAHLHFLHQFCLFERRMALGAFASIIDT
jgi:hypothetical protein